MSTYAISGARGNVIFMFQTLSRLKWELMEDELKSHGLTNIRRYVKVNNGRWRPV